MTGFELRISAVTSNCSTKCDQMMELKVAQCYCPKSSQIIFTRKLYYLK